MKIKSRMRRRKRIRRFPVREGRSDLDEMRDNIGFQAGDMNSCGDFFEFF